MQALHASWISLPRRSLPSTTVQAPQSPSAQPSFVPVARSSSRSQSRTVPRGEKRSSATSRPRNRKRSAWRGLTGFVCRFIVAPQKDAHDGAFAGETEARESCARRSSLWQSARDVGRGEVAADEQEWAAFFLRQRIGEAVAEVEGRSMEPFAPSLIGVRRAP